MVKENMAVKSPTISSSFYSASNFSFPPESFRLTSSRTPSMASQGLSDVNPEPDNQLSKTPSTHETPLHVKSLSSPKPTETRDDDNIPTQTSDQPHDRVESNAPDDANNVQVSPRQTTSLKIDTGSSVFYNPLIAREDEPPQSVIHAPLGFGKFQNGRSSRSSVDEGQSPKSAAKPSTEMTQMSTTSESIISDSTTSENTIVRTTGDESETSAKLQLTQVPPIQTQIPTAQDWTKTPRAQTRKDLGITSRPNSSLASLSSISEDDDDGSDHPSNQSPIIETDTHKDRPAFYRDSEDELGTLQTALTECWTLCNTLAGLSYIHREKIFSRRGNMQQQAWRSCWRLCENLYKARHEGSTMDVRPTLDLCREFCQALFDVRVREDDAADSVLRVSFELNNHLFNTHDRSLPEAFSERTLDFYITLCHRLMKQRSSLVEETSSLLRACWSLAEMLFSIRQTRREGRKPDEELLSSAVQACWELCDLFREGWTQIRPERQTPRPSLTTLSQAYQQARKANLSVPTESGPRRLNPETPTTIFEDITTDSPYEPQAPNIVVLGPEQSDPGSATSAYSSSSVHLQPRRTSYHWPGTGSKSTSTTIESDSSSSLHDGSIQTIRSPTDDPNMILLKALFVRAAVSTNRGFSPLPSTTITTVSAMTSLPLFVKSLSEIAFGSQAWQMNLLDHFRRTVANDATFRILGSAANPTILGIGVDESTSQRIKVDTARATQLVINGTFGWMWLKDLYKFVFGVYLDDVVGDEQG